ncbi:SixA phosphatase family protein [Maricaulis sp. CAU 1757]
MTCILILMRHAKAVDRLEADDDFERGLTVRGRDDAAAVAAQLQRDSLAAELALVSPSWRTRQTYSALEDALGKPRIEDPMALYHASTAMLERAARRGFADARSILVVGHNPGIGGLAHKLARQSGDDAEAALSHGYPTATATAFQLAGPDFETPRLIGVYRP